MSAKRTIKLLKINFWLMFSLFWFIVLFIVYFFIISLPSQKYHPEIKFEGMNQLEIDNAYEILFKVKTSYYNSQKSILFTKNISKYCDDCVGMNQRKNIIVEYYADEATTKLILCHEMLHTVLSFGSMKESFVEDLDDYFPCFLGGTSNQ